MALDFSKLVSKVRITDGAWGTQLQRRGLPPGLAPELWNVERPMDVAAVAGEYVAAGSDIILSNTFGANRFVLAAHGLAQRTVELAERGAAISRQAAGRAAVFASVGPTGKIVMMEEVPEAQVEMAFAEAATGVTHGGADAIVLETFNELDELEIALRAVKQASNLPVVACMTFASGPDQTASMMGNTPADLAHVAEELGADAVGANCGHGPEGYVRVCELLRAATRLPIWIKANAGLPQVSASGATVFPMGPQEFANYANMLIAAGANFIGGCCGTTPEHIRALRAAVP